MKRLLSTLIILVATFCTSMAQPGDPGGDPDNPVPITGIEVLIAAGAALGIRSFVKSKK